MPVRKIKPTTPGQRHKLVISFDTLTNSEPTKSLLKPNKRSGGRNSRGKMTIQYVGGGHKRKYRIIDFKRDKKNIPAKVDSIEYDPNRTSFISLLKYVDGEKRYIIAPDGLKVGDEVVSSENAPIKVGNALPLSKIPLGSVIHNLELYPGSGAKIARSAGSYAQLMAREGKYATIKLVSGEIRKILITCLATLGSVSNSEHQLQVSGKAGKIKMERKKTEGKSHCKKSC